MLLDIGLKATRFRKCKASGFFTALKHHLITVSAWRVRCETTLNTHLTSMFMTDIQNQLDLDQLEEVRPSDGQAQATEKHEGRGICIV